MGIEVGMVEEGCDGAGDCEGEFWSDILFIDMLFHGERKKVVFCVLD